MKIIETLVIITLILFPLGELVRFNIGNNIVLKPMDIVVGLTAIFWLINYFIQKHKTAFEWKILLFPLIGLLSLIINSTWLKPLELLASFLYLIRWLAYASFYYIILRSDKQFKNKINFFMFIDGIIILGFGILQYIFIPSLKSLYYLGWDEHLYRIFSVFLDPNYSGAFFVLYFLFIADKLYKEKKPRWYLILILLLTLLATLLTFSRSALITIIVGAFVYLFIIRKKILILMLLGAIALFIIILSPKFENENMNLFRKASSTARLTNYSTAIEIITDRPLFGIGFNSYRYAKKTYGIDMEWIDTPSHADAGVDNSFLFVLATTGIVGFLVYLNLWKSITKKASALVISSVIALFINALFINSLFFPPLMLWMWLILALL